MVSIKDEHGEQQFKAKGGDTLLSALIANRVKISASCGGRGSCGYCKVQVSAGGGQILPTEEIFIGKEERKQGTRLACQVKVKEDIRLFIPDLLTSVKAMAKSGTFDTRLRWTFLRTDRPQIVPVPKKHPKLARSEQTVMESIVEKYAAERGAIMPVLQEINEKYKYLPAPVLKNVSRDMAIPLSEIYRIATFYNAFSLKPRGKYTIAVCTGTACHVKGAADILAAFEEQLGIKTGETTPERQFSLSAVRCIGCCGLAPVITVNEEVHGLMTMKKIPEIVEIYRGK